MRRPAGAAAAPRPAARPPRAPDAPPRASRAHPPTPQLGWRALDRSRVDHVLVPLLWNGALLAERLLEPLQRGPQLELAEELAQARPVGRLGKELAQVDVHLDAAHGGGELLGDARVLG